MITFLPVPDFERVMKLLDDKRLGGQRVEAKAILKWLRNPERYKNFQNAGFCRMWRGFEPALALYYNAAVREWGLRGYRNIECVLEEVDPEEVKLPPWLGDDELHSCHRAALLSKLPEHYGEFGWTEEPQVAYLWPEKQEDGSWNLVPPKGGRSKPKSESRKTKNNNEQREHWMSKARKAAGRKQQQKGEQKHRSGDSSPESNEKQQQMGASIVGGGRRRSPATGSSNSKRKLPLPPSTPSVTDEALPRKRLTRRAAGAYCEESRQGHVGRRVTR